MGQDPAAASMPDHRYDEPSPALLRGLSDLIGGRRCVSRLKPLGLWVFDGSDPMSDLGRSVEAAVFGEHFGNSPELMAEEYGPYEDASTFVVVADTRQSKPVGVMRIIKNSSAGLKTTNDLAAGTWALAEEDVLSAYALKREDVWDIATIAVAPGYRGSRVTPILYWWLYGAVVHRGIRAVVAILDTKVRPLLSSLGIPSEAICGAEPMEYLASPSSVPVLLDVGKMASAVKSKSYVNYLILGKGLGIRHRVSLP